MQRVRTIEQPPMRETTMPRINLATSKRPIVPVTRATLRTAMRTGVDPYNSVDGMSEAYARYARMCGARPVNDELPAILRPQAA
jgi:hypothetical protein